MMREVDRRNAEAGAVVWSLGHVVPLQHPLVCGLHWHGNMVIEPLAENMKKCNLSWPDMPEIQMELLP